MELAPALPSAEIAAPIAHAYVVLTEQSNEPQGYAMYTYVLFGSRITAASIAADDLTVRRYRTLLGAITETVGTRSEVEAASIPPGETDLFCIPGRSPNANDAGLLSNYNSGLDFTYLTIAERVVANANLRSRLQTRAGPFLLSTLEPLPRLENGSSMLFADLSSTNPNAMREVVASYKQRIDQSAVIGEQRFAPLRLALLTAILNADENVQLERSAVAAWLPGESDR